MPHRILLVGNPLSYLQFDSSWKNVRTILLRHTDKLGRMPHSGPP